VAINARAAAAAIDFLTPLFFLCCCCMRERGLDHRAPVHFRSSLVCVCVCRRGDSHSKQHLWKAHTPGYTHTHTHKIRLLASFLYIHSLFSFFCGCARVFYFGSVVTTTPVRCPVAFLILGTTFMDYISRYSINKLPLIDSMCKRGLTIFIDYFFLYFISRWNTMEAYTLVFLMVMERLCRIVVIHPPSLKLLLTSTCL
jgi:hypothetical protein